MKLGKFVQINLSTHDVNKSFEFYQKLGFRELERRELPYRWLLMTDGTHNFILSENKFRGVTYYASDMDERLAHYAQDGIDVHQSSLEIGTHYYNEANSPAGLNIALVKYDEAKLRQPDETVNLVCGKFYEISLLVEDLNSSLDFWRHAGFDISFDEKDWKGVNDGMLGIGLYTKKVISHYFEGPALTFFANDMAERIKIMREKGIPFKEEIKNKEGLVDNAIAVSPEGQTLFFFQA